MCSDRKQVAWGCAMWCWCKEVLQRSWGSLGREPLIILIVKMVSQVKTNWIIHIIYVPFIVCQSYVNNTLRKYYAQHHDRVCMGYWILNDVFLLKNIFKIIIIENITGLLPLRRWQFSRRLKLICNLRIGRIG